MRLIDGLTPDLSISVSNRFSFLNRKSIDVKVVRKLVDVTKYGRTTIDTSQIEIGNNYFSIEITIFLFKTNKTRFNSTPEHASRI